MEPRWEKIRGGKEAFYVLRAPYGKKACLTRRTRRVGSRGRRETEVFYRITIYQSEFTWSNLPSRGSLVSAKRDAEKSLGLA